MRCEKILERSAYRTRGLPRRNHFSDVTQQGNGGGRGCFDCFVKDFPSNVRLTLSSESLCIGGNASCVLVTVLQSANLSLTLARHATRAPCSTR